MQELEYEGKLMIMGGQPEKSESVSISARPMNRNPDGTYTMGIEPPRGKTYKDIGREIGELVEKKQEAYGDSFSRSGNVLREMYPHGIQPEQYDDMLCVVRMIDKLFRIANKKDAFGESPYRDLVGYGLLGVYRDEQNKKEEK